MKKWVLISIGLGFLFSVLVHIALISLSDFHNGHTMTLAEVEAKMDEKPVVNLAIVEGSRVYAVYEDGEYAHYVFGIGMFSDRYRFWWRVEYASFFPGRWRRFHAYVQGSEITYTPYGVSHHLTFGTGISFLTINAIFAGVAWHIIKKQKPELT
ncbi:MAG: hypothetical protein FWB98_07835 [Defluviitaleaceae bacterium]|nr:hypothetical protein [Defluviitaleaceae bacterium]